MTEAGRPPVEARTAVEEQQDRTSGPDPDPGRPPAVILDRRYLLLALVPLAVYGLGYLVLDATRRDDVHLAIIASDAFASVAAAEARYRSFWVAAFLLSAAASVAVAATAGLGLVRLRLARDRGPIAVLILAVILLATVVETADGLRGGTRWYDGLGRVAAAPAPTPANADAHTAEASEAVGGSTAPFQQPGLFRTLFAVPPGASLPGTDPPLHLLDLGLDIVKILGAIALTLVGAGLVLTLAIPDRSLPPAAEIARLGHALARQQELLHLAAVVYVLALVAMLAWMHWPLPYLDGEAARAAYRDLLFANAIVQGTTYSLGIAALYLPAATLLRRRIADIAEATPTATPDWLRSQGLAHQPLDQLRQIATILLPTIIGLLPALEKLWG